MRLWSVAAWHGVVGAAVVLGLAACQSPAGGGPSTSTAASSGKPVPAVDGCTVLSAQELANLGLQPQGTPGSTGGEVGCSYKGQRYLVDLERDPTRTVAGYLAGASNYLSDRENSVNGRRSALVQSADIQSCTQFLELGGGVFVVRMTYRSGQTGDPCGEATSIAKVVEPKLPKS